MKSFYEKYFNATIGDLYINEKKKFKSYLLHFDNNDCKIEIMNKDGVSEFCKDLIFGYAHLALSTGSKDNVVKLTQRLENDGYTVISQPRITGDGFYESAILDPEGNTIEITV